MLWGRRLKPVIFAYLFFEDVFVGLLLFIPVFGNRTGSPSAASLLSHTGIRQWIKYLFFGSIIVTVLNGIFGVIISGMDKPVWIRHRNVAGMIMMIIYNSWSKKKSNGLVI